MSQDDIRQRVHLNTFGFYKDGYMSISMNSLSFSNGNTDDIDSSTVIISSLSDRLSALRFIQCIMSLTVLMSYSIFLTLCKIPRV